MLLILNKCKMKHIILLSVLCGMFLTFVNDNVSAQNETNTVLASNNVLSVKGMSLTANDVENFKNFEIEANEAGSYNAQFWVLPAKYDNGSFTKFNVYVNDVFAGAITPQKGNWQSLPLDGGKALKLNRGDNVVSISTNAPETPNVESIRVSKNANAATFSSTGYDNYLSKAMSPNIDAIASQSDIEPAAIENGMMIRQNIPLKYSFFQTYEFTEGQEIFITASSRTEHSIDFFFYGTNYQNLGVSDTAILVVPKHISRTPSNPQSEGDFVIGRAKYIYTPATPEEIQGLNWRSPSELTLNTPQAHVSTMLVTIPKTGYYMVKLRSTQNKVLGVADVNVNGDYFYENVPIYYSKVDCEMPAGTKYGALAMSYNNGDDPMLFVEGAGSYKIVGYNDDAPAKPRQDYDLRYNDSYVGQTYFFPTKALHVCNYSSEAPESACTVIGRIPDYYESQEAPKAIANARKSETGNTSGNLFLEESVSISPKAAELSSSVTVSSNNMIKKIQVFDMSGIKIADCTVNDYSSNIRLSEMNINNRGIYIVSVETDNGTTSLKITAY